MKFSNLARTALMGLAAFATLASAQRTPPPVIKPLLQIGLVADAGHPGMGDGRIHRVNVLTGAFLGDFGMGCLGNTNSIDVQPSTGVAYVADAAAIKKFDVKTGAYLGYLVLGSTLGGTIDKIRFTSAGDLYAIVGQGYIPNTYKLFRLNATTGAVVGSSIPMQGKGTPSMGLGFRPDGRVEVNSTYEGDTYIDSFTPDAKYTGYDYISGLWSVYRTSNDRVFRWLPSGMQTAYGMVGDLSLGGSFLANIATNSPVLFAEGAGHYVYALSLEGSYQPYIYRFNANGTPSLNNQYWANPFSVVNLVDMSVYVGP